MKAVHEMQGRTPCRADWSQRVAQLIAALAVVVAVTPMSFAQPVEIAYNTFLDPNNATDPRAAAQTNTGTILPEGDEAFNMDWGLPGRKNAPHAPVLVARSLPSPP